MTAVRRIARTAAPRSAVVHMVAGTGTYLHQTACGRRIGDEWAGEYSAEPTGPVTCKRCAPIVAEIEAEQAAWVAANAVHAVGDRVGILTGLQSKNGAHVGAYGTVKGAIETWDGVIEYSVIADGETEAFLYRSYLLQRDTTADHAEAIAEDIRRFPGWTDADARIERAAAMRRHPAGKARPNLITEDRSTYGLDAFPGVAEDDGRTGIVKSGGSLYFRLF